MTKQNAWGIIKTDWDECGVGFTCPCGQKELVVNTEEPTECPNCHRVYTLKTPVFTVDDRLVKV